MNNIYHGAMVALAFFCACLIGCAENDTSYLLPTTAGSDKSATITFSCLPELEAVTRASVTDESMTDVWVFDTFNGVESMVAHQVSTDENFGTVSVTLAYGTHSLSFVTSRGVGADYGDGVLSWTKVRPTYGKVVSLAVDGTTKLAQSVTLTRLDAVLEVKADDAEHVACTAEYTMGVRYYGINVADLSGAASAANDVTSHVWATADAVDLTMYTMCPSSSEWNTTVKIRLYDNDGDIATHTKEVPLLSNRRTLLHGDMFSAANSTTLNLDTEMLTEKDVPLYE